jgi:hypothetical protein
MAGLFAAALAVAFASVTSEAEVLVLEVRTARTTVELRKALGQLTDGCLLRVDLSQDPPLNEVLRRVRLLYRNAQLHLPASVHDVLRLPDVDDALADRQIVAFDHLRADWAPALPPGTWPFATRGMEFVYGNLSACMRREVSAHFSVIDSPRSLSWSVRDGVPLKRPAITAAGEIVSRVLEFAAAGRQVRVSEVNAAC